ncbi:GyrI-like domain-containing protein [Neisseria sp. S1]|uniref:GyrI-like domain-containing protein n=1 Tax=Neisseria sp. S1 TaxID=3318354 RepID=UPI003A881289
MNIIGIAIRTTNQNKQAAQDMTALWQQFFAEHILEKIPNKLNTHIVSIYTDYKSDYTGAYTAILGAEVNSLDTIPEGMVGRTFPEQKFQTFLAKGCMPGAVVTTWQSIWQQDEQLNRAYTYDYELYTERAQSGEQSEVPIMIAIK